VSSNPQAEVLGAAVHNATAGDQLDGNRDPGDETDAEATNLYEALVFEAFVAGFAISGEGWNGEILTDRGTDLQALLRSRFEAWCA